MSPEKQDELTVAELQLAVHEWISQWKEGYFHPLSNLARLTEEVGELSRELNHRFGDKPRKSPEDTADIASELGDILWVVAALGNQLDVDLTDAFFGVMHKLNERDGSRFTPRDDTTA